MGHLIEFVVYDVRNRIQGLSRGVMVVNKEKNQCFLEVALRKELEDFSFSPALLTVYVLASMHPLKHREGDKKHTLRTICPLSLLIEISEFLGACGSPDSKPKYTARSFLNASISPSVF